MCRGRNRVGNRVGEVQARGGVGDTVVHMFHYTPGTCLSVCVPVCRSGNQYTQGLFGYIYISEVHPEDVFFANIRTKYVQSAMLKVQVPLYGAYWCVCTVSFLGGP